MLVVKIKYPVNLNPPFKNQDFRKYIRLIEVLEIFQYDRMNFFTLKRIIFKDNYHNVEKIINDVFQPFFFQVIERTGNEFLCLMKLRNDQGFYPAILAAGSWAILPPIIINEQNIKISFIVQENFNDFMGRLSINMKNPEIIAINTIQNTVKSAILSNKFLTTGQPFPHFSKRQHEIASYAAHHGYYESPKKISAKELATTFKISPSALYEHLQKAEHKAMRYFFL